jgi:catechol 2,3-dioxygenase-like lactoylglutathione lyase family enzyme
VYKNTNQEALMVKVTDVEFVRFAAPDLAKMERFLCDFGLVRVEAGEADAAGLYMRGSGPDAWLHQTVEGDPGFRGLGLAVASAEDLEILSRMDGASAIETLSDPGGGQCVRLTDPDGFSIEVVHGRAPAPPIVVERALPLNMAAAAPRIGQPQRVPKGPARVRRLGHVVLHVSDFRASVEWYQERFGFLASDEIYLGDEDNLITAFMRCDRGAQPVDHHTLLCIGVGPVGFNHAAFEVEDFDAVMSGHEFLRAAGYQHNAGIGRHILGSQIFDYWKDPWGHIVEHFTDGDLFDATKPSQRHDVATALGTHWGSPPGP